MIEGIAPVLIVEEAFVLMGIGDFSVISRETYPMTNDVMLTVAKGGKLAGTEGGMLAGTEGGTIGMKGGKTLTGAWCETFAGLFDGAYGIGCGTGFGPLAKVGAETSANSFPVAFARTYP